jgi:hypothetical protein
MDMADLGQHITGPTVCQMESPQPTNSTYLRYAD